jgi:hypothetical protein
MPTIRIQVHTLVTTHTQEGTITAMRPAMKPLNCLPTHTPLRHHITIMDIMVEEDSLVEMEEEEDIVGEMVVAVEEEEAEEMAAVEEEVEEMAAVEVVKNEAAGPESENMATRWRL